jgi:hypothetical protein
MERSAGCIVSRRLAPILPERGISAVLCLTAVASSIGCVATVTPRDPPDRSFCAIAEQMGKPNPSLVQVGSLTGRYQVSLYSADSGKVLQTLTISLIPTDSSRRSPKDYFRTSRRTGTEQYLAYGGLFGKGFKNGRTSIERPPVALYFSDNPRIAIFPQVLNYPNAIVLPDVGMFLNIKQVVQGGFAGTVDQIGSVTASRASGQPWQRHGPHFFCAVERGYS